MRTFIRFYNSSVGKKLMIGMTGFLLCLYLIIHLVGNLLLFRNDGGYAFDMYAELLPQVLIIRIIEILLFLLFIIHFVSAAYTWYINKRSRGRNYKIRKPGETSVLTSRTMFLSGSIIFFFLVVHMRQFWYSSRYEAAENYSMYAVVKEVLSDPVYGILYIVAMFLLGFHLHHGFQSAFQTFGLRNKRYTQIIEWIGAIFWLLIPLGFASLPAYFLMNF